MHSRECGKYIRTTSKTCLNRILSTNSAYLKATRHIFDRSKNGSEVCPCRSQNETRPRHKTRKVYPSLTGARTSPLDTQTDLLMYAQAMLWNGHLSQVRAAPLRSKDGHGRSPRRHSGMGLLVSTSHMCRFNVLSSTTNTHFDWALESASR